MVAGEVSVHGLHKGPCTPWPSRRVAWPAACNYSPPPGAVGSLNPTVGPHVPGTARQHRDNLVVAHSGTSGKAAQQLVNVDHGNDGQASGIQASHIPYHFPGLQQAVDLLLVWGCPRV